MKRTLLLAAMMATSSWAATTYTYTGTNYSLITNFTSCTTGPCANFTGAMNASGSFTLAAALPANLSLQDITSQLVSYSFSDGVTTFANTDPNVRINFFSVSTDGAGHISNTNIELEVWQTGSSPHVPGNRLALLDVAGTSNVGVGTNDVGCLLLGTGSSGVADTCTALAGDSSTSTAQNDGGSWTGGGGVPTPTAVPTLGEWGMISLAVLLGAFAWLRLSRQEPSPPPAI